MDSLYIIVENPIKIDDLGVSLFVENSQLPLEKSLCYLAEENQIPAA